MTSPLRILVLGYIVRRPLGGGTWPTLQYAMGLKRLGHDVFFVEDSEDFPCCYDPTRHVTDEDPTRGLQYAEKVFQAMGLGDRWAYYDAHQDVWHGPCAGTILEICTTADLVLTASGPLRPWTRQVPRRAFIDTDPAFEQIRHLNEPSRADHLRAHDTFFTYGVNITTGGSTVPDDGLPWQATRPPVVLDAWPVTPGPAAGPFTTVMQWESYPAREYQGVRYGMKSEAFPPYRELPRRTTERLEIALGSPGAPRDELRRLGWEIIDPLVPSRDPWTHQTYLQRSKGEFTIAKHGYVSTDCGWFSERSANYLASGRPVITQETGFSRWLPVGAGLFAFSTLDEAVSAIDEVCGKYEWHCAQARELAREYFDSDIVLTRLVERAMAAEGPGGYSIPTIRQRS